MTHAPFRLVRQALLLATAALGFSTWAAPDHGHWQGRDGERPGWQVREEQRQRHQAQREHEQEWQRQQREELRDRAEAQRRRDEAWQRRQEEEQRHRAESQRRRDEAWQRQQEDQLRHRAESQRWREEAWQRRQEEQRLGLGSRPHPVAPPGFAHPGSYRWERGQRYHGHRQVVHDWRHQRLRPPPPGHQWVRAEGGYLLLAAPTGVILEFVAR